MKTFRLLIVPTLCRFFFFAAFLCILCGCTTSGDLAARLAGLRAEATAIEAQMNSDPSSRARLSSRLESVRLEIDHLESFLSSYQEGREALASSGLTANFASGQTASPRTSPIVGASASSSSRAIPPPRAAAAIASSSGAISLGKPKAEAPAELVTVTAKGQGESVEAAKKDAIRNAIKKAVGELVEAKTLVENNELVEDKILTLSNAVVEKADYGDAASIGDGLVEVPVKAVVKKGRLNQELKAVGIATGDISGDSLAAQLGSGLERIANAEKFFAECFTGFPSNVVEAIMLAKKDNPPLVYPNLDTGHFFAAVALRINMKNYAEWAQRAQRILEAVCVSKEETTLAFKDDIASISVPKSRRDRVDPIPVVLATPMTTERDMWSATVYYLDERIFKALRTVLEARLPQTGTIEVSLADGDGNTVCSATSNVDRSRAYLWCSQYGYGYSSHSPGPFPMAGEIRDGYNGHIIPGAFLAIGPAPVFGALRGGDWGASMDSIEIYRGKRIGWRRDIDLGKLSVDDIAKVVKYEVKIKFLR